jgi:hypothetical protein
MTEEQKVHLSETVLPVMAEVAGKSFSTAAIVMMVESMDDLDYDAVIKTLSEWGRTSRYFPHPSDIREKIKPEINPSDDAELVANLVISAVGKYGYTNPDKARKLMGELGWETVKLMGGWKHLCEALEHDNETTFRAQIRNLAGTVRRKALRGDLHVAPELPQSSELKNLISKTMKGLE